VIARCVALAMIAMLAAPAIAEAQLGVNCTIGTTPVAFGDYNVLSATPKTTTGSVTYQCTLGVNIIVTLSRGSSAAFDPRTMRNGAEVLNYNLYRETTFQTIWGDGTGGTQTYTAFAAAAGPGDRDGVWAAAGGAERGGGKLQRLGGCNDRLLTGV
jgi:spore coat protein U-like protein